MDSNDVRRIIVDHLGEAEVEVTNPGGDGRHFEALVISPKFEGLSLVKQHQMVMAPLKEAFEEGLHALRVKTLTRRA